MINLQNVAGCVTVMQWFILNYKSTQAFQTVRASTLECSWCLYVLHPLSNFFGELDSSVCSVSTSDLLAFNCIYKSRSKDEGWSVWHFCSLQPNSQWYKCSPVLFSSRFQSWKNLFVQICFKLTFVLLFMKRFPNHLQLVLL